MRINDLRKWHGADFNFSWFGWDCEGGVFANDKSSLSTCPVTVKLGLGLRHHGDLDVAEGLYGDKALNTSNPLVKKGPIIIDRITYYFE